MRFERCRKILALVALAGLLGSSVTARPACPTYLEVQVIVAAYTNKTPIDSLSRLRDMDDAYCAQGLIAAEIGRSMGVMTGYKAAFTSDRVRAQYQTGEPQRGFLYEKMFLNNGATVGWDFGARPQFAADLIMVVKDYNLHDARTPLEVLSHLSHIVPFIELSDLMFGPGQTVTALNLVATNMGTRMGILGAPIPVQVTQEFLDGLASMVVVMRDHEDNELGRARGSEILGNPIAALQWLAKNLADNGQRIQMNDRISVGAFFPGGTPRPGLAINVQYHGLPGDPSVGVKFR
ncbi:MAG: hydratase [Betaproteobacteria bacterium]|nr:hydratase [Betaproteobacteria bacterium]